MEFQAELSKADKARPATSSTIYTRPPTASSVIQSRSKSHFVSQISSQEALRSLERETNKPEEDEEKYEVTRKRATVLPPASPEFSPKKTIVENTALARLGGGEEGDGTRIFEKFWSGEQGAAKVGRVWDMKREQRAESEIIARQRRWQHDEDRGLIRKISRRQKKEAEKR